MAKYLVDFQKIAVEPGDDASRFEGRLVIDAESPSDANRQFLEWVQAREEFDTISRFVFGCERLTILSNSEKEDS